MGSADEVNIQATELNRTMKVSVEGLLSSLCWCLSYPKKPETRGCAAFHGEWYH